MSVASAVILTIIFAAAADDSALPVAPAPGAKVANFTLKDVHRRAKSLQGFHDKKAFVVVFLGTECPLANLYFPTLVELQKEYADKGVQVLAINSNEQDSFLHVSAHAQERGAPFPVLKDFDQKVADAFGAKRTPEAFLLDSGFVIRYHGRIDDQYGIGTQREKPTRPDLKVALDELLAGKPISTPITETPGCIIARVHKPRLSGEITYAKQVSRILQKRCQECHRPGQIGPMALLDYDSAKSWADTIHEVVEEQRMPPWHADPHFGKFARDRHLTSEESDTLLAWVEQGCPKGDDKDLPAPAKFPEGWTIGTPDLVIRMNEEFKVPATGVLAYQEFTVDPGFKEDMWVQAAECRPGNAKVVHHVVVYIDAPDSYRFDQDGKASLLVGWAPGDMPSRFEKGIAKKIPAGSKLTFEVHYTPNGTAQTDRSSLGIIFAPRPKHEVELNMFATMDLRIPPGAPSHKREIGYTFREDALLLGFMPHMHLRGVSAKYMATFPDGRKETLLYVPDYDFNWQNFYRFVEPLKIPKGTKMEWVAEWDNSADNARNPDATKEIRWGLQTWEEMANGWMEVVWPDRKSP